jgi:FMN phosphatase YigB (HAD superfamily)
MVSINVRKRGVVSFDIDDVLLHFAEGLLAYHNLMYGTSHTKADLRNPKYSELWNCEPLVARQRAQEYILSPHHNGIEVIRGAIEGTSRLSSRGFTLVGITARDTKLRDATYGVLSRYFKNCFRTIHFQHCDDINVLGTKGEVAKRIGAILHVDDLLEHATGVKEVGLESVIFDQPWNQDEFGEHSSIVRVHSWDDIVDHIL